jgi:hypothetical protein
LGNFENNIRGIGSKFLRYIGYDGQEIGKRREVILSPIVATPCFKYECLGFIGRGKNPMTMKNTFLKVEDMTNLL